MYVHTFLLCSFVEACYIHLSIQPLYLIPSKAVHVILNNSHMTGLCLDLVLLTIKRVVITTYCRNLYMHMHVTWLVCTKDLK